MDSLPPQPGPEQLEAIPGGQAPPQAPMSETPRAGSPPTAATPPPWGPGPYGWGPGQYPYAPPGMNPPAPPAGNTGPMHPASAPRRSPWGVAGLIVAVFLSSVLGFGVASRLRAPTVVQSSAPSISTPGGFSGNSGTFPNGSSGNGSTGSTGSNGRTGSANSAAASVAAKVDPGIVDINTVLGYSRASAAGTGMVLTSSGEVLTNNHVVDGATSIKVTVVTTGRTYTATVVGTDPVDDVAVLQVNGASGLKTITAGDSSKVAVGDAVVAIGNALGQGGSPSVVAGIVQSLNQTITASDASGGGAEQLSGLIQTDAALQPGDSGGPLATTDGKVIGMDTAASANYRFQAASGVSFAIPINTALSIARQIESGQAPNGGRIGSAGFLGVQVDSTQAGGAVVAGVQAGTPAAGTGISAGDTIVSVDGKTVGSAQALTSLLGTHRPGDKVTVGWVDASGQSHSAQVTLGTAPAN